MVGVSRVTAESGTQKEEKAVPCSVAPKNHWRETSCFFHFVSSPELVPKMCKGGSMERQD